MGQVWQATDTQLGRQVALKILPEAFASDPDRLARFKREAQILASLNHPNIAAIYGIEGAEGTRALVLELGETPTRATGPSNLRAGPRGDFTEHGDNHPWTCELGGCVACPRPVTPRPERAARGRAAVQDPCGNRAGTVSRPRPVRAASLGTLRAASWLASRPSPGCQRSLGAWRTSADTWTCPVTSEYVRSEGTGLMGKNQRRDASGRFSRGEGLRSYGDALIAIVGRRPCRAEKLFIGAATGAQPAVGAGQRGRGEPRRV